MMSAEKLDRICDLFLEMDNEDITIIKSAIEAHEKRLFAERMHELIKEGQRNGYNFFIQTDTNELVFGPAENVTVTAY